MLLAPTAEHPDKKLLVAKPKRKNVAAKRKAKGGKKKKKKASSGAKRTQSSYMLWMNAEGSLQWVWLVCLWPNPFVLVPLFLVGASLTTLGLLN